MHFRRITSIHQPTNAHIISHKTPLNHFKTLRHVSILSDHHQGALFLTKVILRYSHSILICKRGVVAAYHVVWECVVRRTPSHCSTTHSHTTWYAATTPRLQIRIECEYRNITLARDKAPWWWSDKIETCRSVLKCFKSVLCKIIVHCWLMNCSRPLFVGLGISFPSLKPPDGKGNISNFE